MKIATALSLAREILHHISTKHLDSELLLGHVIQKDRLAIISSPDLTISDEQYSAFRELLLIRAQGKSIAQILGEQEFWGRSFIVSDHTLVPRPDSETLISTVLQLHRQKEMALTIGDFGTGTGCLIITVLLEYLNARGIAFEKSRKAYQTAQTNIQRYKLASRLKIFFEPWEKCQIPLDVIISNPPYIKKQDIASLPETIRCYEPTLALDGGQSGLNCYFSILKTAKRCLRTNGYLIVEIGDHSQLPALSKISPAYGFEVYQAIPDLSGSIRCVVLRRLCHV